MYIFGRQLDDSQMVQFFLQMLTLQPRFLKLMKSAAIIDEDSPPKISDKEFDLHLPDDKKWV